MNISQQADRGKVTDSSRACSDADSDTPPPEPRSHLRVPHEADFLYAYSTTPGNDDIISNLFNVRYYIGHSFYDQC